MWYEMLCGSAAGVTAFLISAVVLRRLFRRKFVHYWYHHAVVLKSWGAFIVDESREDVKPWDRVIRRGLAQGQAYNLKMTINEALATADEALKNNL